MASELIILLSLIALSAIFSGSETALFSLSQSKVDEMVSSKVRNAKLLKKLKSDPHRLLITVLIGSNVVNTAASAFAAVWFIDLFGSGGLGIATGVMTFVILVFGDMAPKAFGYQHAAGVSLFMARPMWLLQWIIFPVVWVLDKIIDGVNFILGSKEKHTVTEGEIVAMLKIGAQEGAIEKQERELIENVLEFNDIEVEEVMTPRVQIEALSIDLSIQEAVDYAIKHSHSRLPVYDGSLDKIVGIMPLKQLLHFYDRYSPAKKLKNLKFTPPLEVPFSKKINKLFREFQRKHQHIAIVIDEHGGTAGIVTMEDLLEEIMGDIEDEFDPIESPIKVIDKNTIVVSGKTWVEDVNDFFKVKFGQNERDTINTSLLDHLHRFPREGETITFPRLKVSILNMDGNVVRKAQIERIKRKKK